MRGALGRCARGFVALSAAGMLAVQFLPAATAGGRATSCRAALRDTLLEDLPLPKKCRVVDGTLIVGLRAEGGDSSYGTRYFSVPGAPKSVARFYRPALKRAAFDVRPPGGEGRCSFEDALGRSTYTCEGVVFSEPGVHASIAISGCGGRSQLAVTYSDDPNFIFGESAQCLDPKGTGRVVKRAAALRFLRQEVCESAFLSLYTYPAVTYSIDQVVSAQNELHEGYEQTSDVEGVCGTLPITGVLKLSADQTSWRLPPEYEEIARGGNVSPDVWLRVDFGSSVQWAALDAGPTVFRPGDPLREALEAFPIVTVKVSKGAGDRDLALEAVPVDTAGEGCVPGQPPSNLWQVGVRAGGNATGPREVALRITAAGGTAETRVLEWTRGLFPDETILVGDFPAGTSLVLDPDGQVDELDENNNSQALGTLPPLECVPV